MSETKLREYMSVVHPTTGLPYDEDPNIASDQLNEKNVKTVRVLESPDLLGWVVEASEGESEPRLFKLQRGADSANKKIGGICQVAIMLLTHPSAKLDLGDASRSALAESLVLAGIISEKDQEDLLKIAIKTVSVGNLAGFEIVYPGHVESARVTSLENKEIV